MTLIEFHLTTLKPIVNGKFSLMNHIILQIKVKDDNKPTNLRMGEFSDEAIRHHADL
jgi:hypothetical protein